MASSNVFCCPVISEKLKTSSNKYWMHVDRYSIPSSKPEAHVLGHVPHVPGHVQSIAASQAAVASAVSGLTLWPLLPLYHSCQLASWEGRKPQFSVFTTQLLNIWKHSLVILLETRDKNLTPGPRNSGVLVIYQQSHIGAYQNHQVSW